MGLDGAETAVLAVLLLRGAQTLNEITTRTERYAEGPGGDSDAVDRAIDRLASRAEPLVVRLERRPGEREPRIDQLWAMTSGEHLTAPAASAPAAASPADAPEPTAPPSTGADRVAELERQVTDLTTRLTAIEEALGLDSSDPI